jgi:hypothetical protein
VFFEKKMGERTMKISLSLLLALSFSLLSGAVKKKVCMKKFFDSDDDWNCDPPEHLAIRCFFVPPCYKDSVPNKQTKQG